MLTPNQIKHCTFSSAGRGAYKSSEVDAFLDRVYADFTSLYSERASLVKKFSSLSNAIDEYNASKNSIATALVNAHTIADQTIHAAKEKAEEILREAEEQAKKIADEKISNADQYAEKRIVSADEYHDRVLAQAQKLIEQSKIQSDKFVAQINSKIHEFIMDANGKAAKILEEAYQNANHIREESNQRIADALDDYENVKNRVEGFQKNSLEALKSILPILENLSVGDRLDLKINEQPEEEESAKISIEDVPDFRIENAPSEGTFETEETSDDGNDTIDADPEDGSRKILSDADFDFNIPKTNFYDLDSYAAPQNPEKQSEEAYDPEGNTENTALFDASED